MKTNLIKILSALMLAVLACSLCGCNESETDYEKIAQKNAKAIVGVWTVESIDKMGETETLADAGAVLTTNVLFGEGKEVQFLSNGTLTTGPYNLKYEMVDNQFIYTYKDQTYAYDCDASGDTIIFSTPDVISVTLKKN